MNNLHTITQILEKSFVFLVQAQLGNSLGFMAQAYLISEMSIDTKNSTLLPKFVKKFIQEFMEAKGLYDISIWLIVNIEAEEIIEALVTYSDKPIV